MGVEMLAWKRVWEAIVDDVRGGSRNVAGSGLERLVVMVRFWEVGFDVTIGGRGEEILCYIGKLLIVPYSFHCCCVAAVARLCFVSVGCVL